MSHLICLQERKQNFIHFIHKKKLECGADLCVCVCRILNYYSQVDGRHKRLQRLLSNEMRTQSKKLHIQIRISVKTKITPAT